MESIFLNSKLYHKNSPNYIARLLVKEHFNDLRSINIKKVKREDIYIFRYLAKKSRTNGSKGEYKNFSSLQRKEERYKGYLNVIKDSLSLLENRPTDFNESKYRRIIDFNEKFKWVKEFQRNFHKEMVKSLTNDKFPYLKSTIKNVSYAVNANEHKGNRHAFIIDMKNFFTQITDEKVSNSLCSLLDLNKDIADMYSVLLTSPYDEEKFSNGKYVLGQGLPSSPLLAFLCNLSFFNYLNELCLSKDIKMTIYVDDITFSSDNPISQDFIDKLFHLFKKNGLSINRKKIARVKNDKIKVITGGYVSQTGVRVKNSKREEIFVQYNELNNLLKNMKDINDYFKIYNLYLKFVGNYFHIAEVEFKYNGNVIPISYKNYSDFIKKYDKFFIRGITKLNHSKLPYSIDNVSKDNLLKLEKCFDSLKFSY